MLFVRPGGCDTDPCLSGSGGSDLLDGRRENSCWSVSDSLCCHSSDFGICWVGQIESELKVNVLSDNS